MPSRRKRFGSAPAVHARIAKDKTKAARFYFRETRKALAERDCGRALANLVTAHRMSAAATENRRGAGHGASYQASTLQRATDRFRKVCLR